MRIERISESEAQTIALGAAIGRSLGAGDVVAIVGELGAGKTRFVRGVAQGLQVNPDLVCSPTYALVNEYPSDGPERPPLVHVDAYRLTGADGLASLGWSSVQDFEAIVAIEWADRIAGEMPDETLWITLEHRGGEAGDTRRNVLISGLALWNDRLGELPCV